MNREPAEKNLTTADMAAAAAQRPNEQAQAMPPSNEPVPGNGDARPAAQDEPLAPLFTSDAATDFRSRWDAVQISFVDDPGQAVRKADELVAQVMQSLAQSFADERSRFESQLNQGDNSGSTENMRVALRRYRSFFQRLLSL